MSVSSFIEVVGWAATAVALLASWRPHLDRGLICLRWYFTLLLIADLGEYAVLQQYGLRSANYRNFYYTADIALAVLGYFVLARLVELAFEKSSLKVPRLRLGAILVFTGVASCSALIVYLLRGGLSTSHLGHELEQNFSFLGMILAILLFITLNVMQVQGVRFRRVVLAFSVLYSASAIVNSLAAIAPPLASYLMEAVPFMVTACMGLIAFSLIAPEPERKTRTAVASAPMAGMSEAAW